MERMTLWYSVDLIKRYVWTDQFGTHERCSLYDELARFGADELEEARRFFESVNIDEMQSRIGGNLMGCGSSTALVDFTECFHNGRYEDEEIWETREYRA